MKTALTTQTLTILGIIDLNKISHLIKKQQILNADHSMSVVLNIVSTTLISVNLCRIMTYFVSMKLKLTNMIQSIWMGILLFHNVEDRSFSAKAAVLGYLLKMIYHHM